MNRYRRIEKGWKRGIESRWRKERNREDGVQRGIERKGDRKEREEGGYRLERKSEAQRNREAVKRGIDLVSNNLFRTSFT